MFLANMPGMVRHCYRFMLWRIVCGLFIVCNQCFLHSACVRVIVKHFACASSYTAPDWLLKSEWWQSIQSTCAANEGNHFARVANNGATFDQHVERVVAKHAPNNCSKRPPFQHDCIFMLHHSFIFSLRYVQCTHSCTDCWHSVVHGGASCIHQFSSRAHTILRTQRSKGLSLFSLYLSLSLALCLPQN